MTKMLGLPNVPISIDFQDATIEEWGRVREEWKKESTPVEGKEMSVKVVRFKKRGHMPKLSKKLKNIKQLKFIFHKTLPTKSKLTGRISKKNSKQV